MSTAATLPEPGPVAMAEIAPALDGLSSHQWHETPLSANHQSQPLQPASNNSAVNSDKPRSTAPPTTTSTATAPGTTTAAAAAAPVPLPKTDKPRPHVCTTCGRSFARLEHLKRHERSHTKEKPFECPECTRCFARRDLLLRHQQKLHVGTTPPARPRNRRQSSSNVGPVRVTGGGGGGGGGGVNGGSGGVSSSAGLGLDNASAGAGSQAGRVRKSSVVAGQNGGAHAAGPTRPRANTISIDKQSIEKMASAVKDVGDGSSAAASSSAGTNLNGHRNGHGGVKRNSRGAAHSRNQNLTHNNPIDASMVNPQRATPLRTLHSHHASIATLSPFMPGPSILEGQAMDQDFSEHPQHHPQPQPNAAAHHPHHPMMFSGGIPTTTPSTLFGDFNLNAALHDFSLDASDAHNSPPPPSSHHHQQHQPVPPLTGNTINPAQLHHFTNITSSPATATLTTSLSPHHFFTNDHSTNTLPPTSTAAIPPLAGFDANAGPQQSHSHLQPQSTAAAASLPVNHGLSSMPFLGDQSPSRNQAILEEENMTYDWDMLAGLDTGITASFAPLGTANPPAVTTTTTTSEPSLPSDNSSNADTPRGAKIDLNVMPNAAPAGNMALHSGPQQTQQQQQQQPAASGPPRSHSIHDSSSSPSAFSTGSLFSQSGVSGMSMSGVSSSGNGGDSTSPFSAPMSMMDGSQTNLNGATSGGAGAGTRRNMLNNGDGGAAAAAAATAAAAAAAAVDYNSVLASGHLPPSPEDPCFDNASAAALAATTAADNGGIANGTTTAATTTNPAGDAAMLLSPRPRHLSLSALDALSPFSQRQRKPRLKQEVNTGQQPPVTIAPTPPATSMGEAPPLWNTSDGFGMSLPMHMEGLSTMTQQQQWPISKQQQQQQQPRRKRSHTFDSSSSTVPRSTVSSSSSSSSSSVLNPGPAAVAGTTAMGASALPPSVDMDMDLDLDMDMDMDSNLKHSMSMEVIPEGFSTHDDHHSHQPHHQQQPHPHHTTHSHPHPRYAATTDMYPPSSSSATAAAIPVRAVSTSAPPPASVSVSVSASASASAPAPSATAYVQHQHQQHQRGQGQGQHQQQQQQPQHHHQPSPPQQQHHHHHHQPAADDSMSGWSMPPSNEWMNYLFPSA